MSETIKVIPKKWKSIDFDADKISTEQIEEFAKLLEAQCPVEMIAFVPPIHEGLGVKMSRVGKTRCSIMYNAQENKLVGRLDICYGAEVKE